MEDSRVSENYFCVSLSSKYLQQSIDMIEYYILRFFIVIEHNVPLVNRII